MLKNKTTGFRLLFMPLSVLFPIFLAVVVGCGGGGNSVTPAEPSGNATAPVAPASGTAPVVAGDESPAAVVGKGSSSSSGKRRRDEIWVDESGQKWFGNVPMDAFFDNAYEVAADQTPVGGSANVASTGSAGSSGDATGVVAVASADPKPSTAEAPMDEAADPAESAKPEPAATAADGDSWVELISLAALEEEIKSIRNFMTENVQTVGTFNSSMLMIPPKAATLGALAEIAIQHPEAVSWKEDAKYVRDLAKKMNSSALQRGAKDQKRIQELFESVTDTLNRSRPAGLEEPPESDSFAEVAEMRLLMSRMEEAEKKLKTEAGSESAMGSKKEMIVHETSMLSVMARIVSMPGYGYGDDEKFTGYAKAVLTGAQAAKEAAESGDFAAYESALTTISTSCSNCHSDFKND